jgi:histone H3/H4
MEGFWYLVCSFWCLFVQCQCLSNKMERAQTRRHKSRKSGRSGPSNREIGRLFKRALIPRTSREALEDGRRIVKGVMRAIFKNCVELATCSRHKTLTPRCLKEALRTMHEKNQMLSLVPLHLQRDWRVCQDERKKEGKPRQTFDEWAQQTGAVVF